MSVYSFRGGLISAALAGTLASCGQEQDRSSWRHQNQTDPDQQEQSTSADQQEEVTPSLATAPDEQILGTVIIPFGSQNFALTADGNQVWTVDMEDRETVTAGVAPKKYLKVTGELQAPMQAENRPYDIGCIYIELVDNVYYRESTRLRLATSGIRGQVFQEVKLPLSMDMGEWQPVPELPGSIELSAFPSGQIKKFDGRVCFQLDFTEAPADQYRGDIIVQYLRPEQPASAPPCKMATEKPACAPGDTPAPDPVPPIPPVQQFSCQSLPQALKAGQSVTLSWTPHGDQDIELSLSSDNPALPAPGTVTATSKTTAVYTAPAKVPVAAKVMITAHPVGLEVLPAFCEVQLVADEQICLPDDGELNGLTGNVYKIPANSQKLPDLGKLQPVAKVVMPNLDVPERAFSAGFPGVVDLFEWFAIRLRGNLMMESAAKCELKLTADDGAILYIDEVQVIDNDGVHPTRSKTTTVNLKKGSNALRVDYFQGPRYHITLQLLWKCEGTTSFTPVPPSAFGRPLQ